MSANIVEALFVHIERVPFDVLKYLDDENEDWLPRLKGVQPERFVHEIRRSLGASPDLQRVAWLYCWLLSRQRICPWLLGSLRPHHDAGRLLQTFHGLRDRAAHPDWSALDRPCEENKHNVLRVHREQRLGSPVSQIRGDVLGPVGGPAIRGCVRRD
ncbi:hypothetical protein MRX96_056698 [Rhipicephalus microplus]